jgi:magnesium-transporting ATPase (P-type)
VVVPSQEIEVGEVVYISNGQHFPADFVLLSSSSDDGICYVGNNSPLNNHATND